MTARSQPALRRALCLSVCLLAAARSAFAQAPPDPTGPRFLPPTEISESLQRAGQHLSLLASTVTPAVVNIESERELRGSKVVETGSGVIVRVPRAREDFIVTNRHVVEGARPELIDIRLYDGRVLHPAQVLDDEMSDLAVLRVNDLRIAPAELGDSDNLEIGHFVLAVGSPFGLSQSVTLGIISAKGRRALELPGRSVINQDFLQTDAAINPGNSGGPLIDLNGRVVGINTAIASQGGGSEGIGFSIPSKLVEFVVSQLVESGRVRRGFLGVVLDDKFDAVAARGYGLEREIGARVVRVELNSPAALAGVRENDIILNFNGQEVLDHADLINRVNITPINQQVRLVVLRNRREETLLVTLAERVNATGRMLPPRNPVPVAPLQNTGLTLLRLTPDFAVQAGYAPGQRGVLVRSAPADQQADGLRPFDVIESVGRSEVNSADEVLAALEQLGDTREVLLQVRRVVDGRPQSVVVIWRQRAD